MVRLCLILLLMMPPAVQADFSYTANNGTITITGYTGPGGAVIIPSTIYDLTVTGIGLAAFQNRGTITSVTIPDGVTNIGKWAFEYTGLTNVTIPNGVISIGDAAFLGCNKLTGVTIGTNVASIGTGAFSGCTRLTSVAVPAGVTSIGRQAFFECASLMELPVETLNSFYSSVDGILFNKNRTTLIAYPCGRAGNYAIPSSVTNIAMEAFRECSLVTTVTIPNSVTTIGLAAFEDCLNLTSIAIPDSVTTIGNDAFADCQRLNSAIIGSGVTGLPYQLFVGCDSLTAVYFRGNAPTSVDPTALQANGTLLVYYLPGTTGWSSTFGGRVALQWNPQLMTLGVRTNRFGFTINGTAGIPIAVEACTSLSKASWISLQTCTLTNGSIYFSDAAWTNDPRRCYRIRSP